MDPFSCDSDSLLLDTPGSLITDQRLHKCHGYGHQSKDMPLYDCEKANSLQHNKCTQRTECTFPGLTSLLSQITCDFIKLKLPVCATSLLYSVILLLFLSSVVRCETDIDECESNPCQNNGTCWDQVDGFICNCTANYTGDYCEYSVSISSQVFNKVHCTLVHF